MVSAKVAVAGLVILAFVLAGGIGISKGAFQKVKKELQPVTQKVKDIQNKNGRGGESG